MKTLLAVGCSFTNPNFTSRAHPEMDCSWPKWPEIVGKELGYEVVNLGKDGSSNDNIMRSAQDYMAEHKVDMVCALWTEPFRLNIHDVYHSNWYTSLKVDNGEYAGHKTSWLGWDIINTKNIAQILMHDYNHPRIANEQLRYIYTLDMIGKFHNVPVYHMHGCSLWKREIYRVFSEVLGDNLTEKQIHSKFKIWLHSYITSPYFSILDKQTNIWGWPFYRELGGELPLRDHMILEFNNRISEKDGHPNAKGQQLMANKYLELIEQNATN